MKTKTFLIGLGVGLVMFCCFVAGWMVGFNEHVSLVNQARAEEPKDNMAKMTTGASYETMYVNGTKYIVFHSYTGDIEVLKY